MRGYWLQKVKVVLLGDIFAKRDGMIISFGQSVLLVTALAILLTINACSPDDTSSIEIPRNANASYINEATQPADIEDHIINSYARLAAKRSDVCPKLLQQGISTDSIERSDEVLTDNHCDYFLYPKSGEHITVQLDDSRIEALLIVPTLHNFANGEYVVDSYDKHVIRMSYNGLEYKPKDLKYDVTIKVKG